MTADLEEKLNRLYQLKKAYGIAEAEWAATTAETALMIEELQAEIAEEVKKMGQTVKTENIAAVFNKGKTTWDGRLLEGLALAHPELLAAKRVGKPTVSFRMLK